MGGFAGLPDSELEIMLVIWDSESLTSTSDIMERLKRTKSVQAIQNYLNRLEEKGFVQCQKIGRLNHYKPLISLDEYRASEAMNIIDRLYESSPSKLFATLLRRVELSDDETAMLKKMLEGEK